jgi:hypothetical protein
MVATEMVVEKIIALGQRNVGAAQISISFLVPARSFDVI